MRVSVGGGGESIAGTAGAGCPNKRSADTNSTHASRNAIGGIISAVDERQVQNECRPLAERRVDADVAARGFGDAFDDGEAEAAAGRRRLAVRAVEGRERLLALVDRHADAVVGDAQLVVATDGVTGH